METGSYQGAGVQLSIVPEGEEALEGVISDGSITVPVKPSLMARERSESTLVLTDNPVAGGYRATLQGPVTVEATLYLSLRGDYFYLAVPGNDAEHVYEEGAYTAQACEFVFTTRDGQTFTGIAGEYPVSAPFLVSKVMCTLVVIELAR